MVDSRADSGGTLRSMELELCVRGSGLSAEVVGEMSPPLERLE